MDATKLDGLEGLVSEADALGGPTPEQAQEAQQQAEQETEAQAWGMVAYTVGGALSMLAPELKAVYTEAACMNWGRAVVPVAAKYGWQGPGALPELSLLVATAGFVVPSFLVIRRKLETPPAAKDAAGAKDGGLLDALRRWWAKRQEKRKADGEALADGAPGGG